MNSEAIVDPELERVIGSASSALRAWGMARSLRWRLDRRLTEGRSGAIVAFVFELDGHNAAGGTQAHGTKLLLKLDNIPDELLAESEFARQREALKYAPPSFAGRLTPLAPEGHDLVAVGDGRWIMFQEVAAMPIDGMDRTVEIHDLDVLSKALASVSADGPVPATGPSTEEPVHCSSEAFVSFCVEVVRAVLDDWAGHPAVEPMGSAKYLRLHLQARLDEGQPLQTIAGRLEHDWLIIGPDRKVEPNPFVLLRDDGPAAALRIPALLGRAHGDLNTGNILAPVNALTADSPFRLIDLARYFALAPLARDPAGLVLYIVTRVLRYLHESEQEAIGQLLVCTDDQRASIAEGVPAWLADLVEGTRRVAERWSHHSASLQLRDWRPQWLLSLAGCALILISRASTRAADRVWLLTVAARATRAVLGAALPPRTRATSVTAEMLFGRPAGPPARRPDTWREAFCEYLPRGSRKADEHGVSAQFAALRQAAIDGEDRAAEFGELVRRIDGIFVIPRSPDDAHQQVDDVYTCPLPNNKCARVVRADPMDDKPRCALNKSLMRHEFW